MASLRRSDRKQQTRLTFSPLPSSSPAASDYSEQLQRRAAAVHCDQSPSPSKKRRVNNVPPHQTVLITAQSHGLNTPIKSSQSGSRVRPSESKKVLRKDSFSDEATLPTPMASSQTEVGDGQDTRRNPFHFNSSPQIKLESNSVNHRKRSTEHDRAGDMGSPKSARKSGSDSLVPQTAGHTRMEETVEEEAQYLSDEDELPLPSVRRRGIGSTPVILSSDDDSDSEPAVPITPRQNRVTPAIVSPLRFLVGGRSGAAPLSDFQRRKKVSSTKQREATTKPSKSASPPKRFLRSSAGPQANRNLAQSSSDDETELDTPECIQTNFERKPPNAADRTDDGDILPRVGRAERLKSKVVTVTSSGSESSDEDLMISPSRRRHAKKAVELLSPESQNSANDLQEDLDALRGTEILRNRTRTRRNTYQRSKRQEQLELLRRRRAGNEKTAIQDLESSADLGGETLQAQSEDDEISEEGADSATEAVRQTLSEGQNLNEYVDDDDGFLDDEEDTIGAPLGLEDIPLEFTRHAHKKPIQHFKDIVEWMIHNKLNPAFPRHDPIYQIAVRRLDNEVQGYSSSKFLSSAWNANFLTVLKARPELSRLDVPTMFDHKCDACNRSGHPAKHQLTFSGRPYNRDTLENLTDDEDEISEDNENGNDDEESRPLNDEGNSTSNQEQSFYLGRTCALNAETAHALYHWRHHLNQYVLNWLKNNGHTGPEKIVERENWSTKRREKYANKVVDGMEESGEMKILYKEFKENLNIAREARPERYTYGRR